MWLAESGLATPEEAELKVHPAVCYGTSGISPESPGSQSPNLYNTRTLTTSSKECLPRLQHKTDRAWCSWTLASMTLVFGNSMSCLDQSSILSLGWKERMEGLSSSKCLSSPYFHLFIKPHQETAQTLKLEHEGPPFVSNNIYFQIVKFHTQIPVQG